MSDSNQNFTEAYLEQLLREGIAAAKSGDRMAARQKLRQVTELDQFNERGWFWLASVVETDEEKRVCLGNVVVINPNNEKAKQMLDQLIAGGKRGFDVTNTVGVALGRFNKLQPAQRVVVLLGAVAVAALLFFMLSLVGGGGSTGVPTADSLYTPTTAAVAVQNTAVADTETPTPSETPTETPQRGPTLPPTWTREPSFTPVTRIKSTPLAAPPAEALVGRMIVSIGLPLTLDKNLPLYLYNPKTKEITNLTTPERGDYGVFFPDGVRYAFSRYLSGTGSLQIRIVNLNGTQGRELSDTWGRNPVLADHRMITISSNGMKIAFSAINKRENDSSPDIYVLPVFFPPASSTATPTVTPTITLTSTSTLNPLVTPTETLTATPTTPPPRDTMTPTPVPALLQRLTDKDSGDNLWPSLSPDGSKLLYVSDKQEFNGTGTDLYLVDLTSGAQTNLTNDGQDQLEAAPRWSPDGTKIVFQAGTSDTKTGIYVMDADGTNRQTLVEPNANNIRPVWSPDAQYVGFTSDLSGKLEIFIVDLATLTVTQLTSMEDPITLNDWAN